jgi:hypothetical protein
MAGMGRFVAEKVAGVAGSHMAGTAYAGSTIVGKSTLVTVMASKYGVGAGILAGKSIGVPLLVAGALTNPVSAIIVAGVGAAAAAGLASKAWSRLFG